MKGKRFKTTIVFLAVVFASAAYAFSNQDYSGHYDTSIMGYFNRAAYINIEHTNVWLIVDTTSDGRHNLGFISNDVWHAKGGSRWHLEMKNQHLLITEQTNQTCTHPLKLKMFAKQRMWFREFLNDL